MDKLTKIALKEMGFTVHTKPIDAVIVRRAFNFSIGNTLEEVYKSYSSKKRNAFDFCKQLAKECDAVNFAISSANQYRFTVIFTFTLNGVKLFARITEKNNHCFEVCDE